MQNMDTLTEASNPFRSKNTEKKREQREKIVQGFSPFAKGKILTKQHNVACLCVSENTAATIIRISVLKSSGERKHYTEKHGI